MINTLVGQRATLTGDEAGITKLEQKIVLAPGLHLFDTLAAVVAIAERHGRPCGCWALFTPRHDEGQAALALLANVRVRHADRLAARYKLGDLDGLTDRRTAR